MHKERPDDEVAVVGTSLMAQTVLSDDFIITKMKIRASRKEPTKESHEGSVYKVLGSAIMQGPRITPIHVLAENHRVKKFASARKPKLPVLV